MKDIQVRKINIDNLEIAYVDEGKGINLVMLHGWMTSKEIYYPIINRLGSKYRMIAPDLPGFGSSQPKSSINDFKSFGKFVLRFVQELDLDEYYLMGNSMGGAVTASILKEVDDKLKGIILRAPLLSSKMIKTRLNNVLIKNVILRATKNEFLLESLGEVVYRGFIRVIGNGDGDNEKKEIVRKVKENARGCSWRVARDSIADGFKIDYLSDLRNFKRPKVVLVPTRDELLDFSVLPKDMPSARIDEKHAILKGDYDRLSKHVDKFLSGNK